MGVGVVGRVSRRVGGWVACWLSEGKGEMRIFGFGVCKKRSGAHLGQAWRPDRQSFLPNLPIEIRLIRARHTIRNKSQRVGQCEGPINCRKPSATALGPIDVAREWVTRESVMHYRASRGWHVRLVQHVDPSRGAAICPPKPPRGLVRSKDHLFVLDRRDPTSAAQCFNGLREQLSAERLQLLPQLSTHVAFGLAVCDWYCRAWRARGKIQLPQVPQRQAITHNETISDGTITGRSFRCTAETNHDTEGCPRNELRHTNNTMFVPNPRVWHLQFAFA